MSLDRFLRQQYSTVEQNQAPFFETMHPRIVHYCQPHRHNHHQEAGSMILPSLAAVRAPHVAKPARIACCRQE